MSTLTPHTPSALEPAPVTSRSAWLVVLAWLTGIVAASDLIFFVLISTVIPPLAVGAALTAVGLALVRRRPRPAAWTLGLTNLMMLAGALPFALPHLAHPASALDFTHAVAGSVGRGLALVATIGLWRAATAAAARRLAVSSIGIAAATVAVASVAMLTTTGDEATDDDVLVAIEDAVFPDVITVATGDTLFVDNQDLFRHTFSVLPAGLDVELPATQGVRIPLDLPAGTYEVTCEVPGHEFMTATLQVR